MSYPAFGKVKTIVLPIPGHTYTLDEYQNKYGIDLREFIRVTSTQILLDFGCANVLLKITKEYEDALSSPYVNMLSVINSVSVDEVDSDNDAETILKSDTILYAGLALKIRRDREMKIENIEVYGLEL